MPMLQIDMVIVCQALIGSLSRQVARSVSFTFSSTRFS